MYTFAYMDAYNSELMVVQCSNDSKAIEMSYEFADRFPAVSGVYYGSLTPEEMAEIVADIGFKFINGVETNGSKPAKFMRTIRNYIGF